MLPPAVEMTKVEQNLFIEYFADSRQNAFRHWSDRSTYLISECLSFSLAPSDDISRLSNAQSPEAFYFNDFRYLSVPYSHRPQRREEFQYILSACRRMYEMRRSFFSILERFTPHLYRK